MVFPPLGGKLCNTLFLLFIFLNSLFYFVWLFLAKNILRIPQVQGEESMIFHLSQWVPQRNRISKQRNKRILHLVELIRSGETIFQTWKVDMILYKNSNFSSNYKTNSTFNSSNSNNNNNSNKVIVSTCNILIT